MQYLKIQENYFIPLNHKDGDFLAQTTITVFDQFIELPHSVNDIITSKIENDYVYAIFARLDCRHLNNSLYIGVKRKNDCMNSELVFFDSVDSTIRNKFNKLANSSLLNWNSITDELEVCCNAFQANSALFFSGFPKIGRPNIQGETIIAQWKKTFVETASEKTFIESCYVEKSIQYYPKDANFTWLKAYETNLHLGMVASFDDIIKAQVLSSKDIDNCKIYAVIGAKINLTETSTNLTYLISIPEIGIRQVEKSNSQLYQHIQYLSLSNIMDKDKSSTVAIRLYNGECGGNIFSLASTNKRKKQQDNNINTWNCTNNYSDCAWITNKKTAKQVITDLEFSNQNLLLTTNTIKKQTKSDCDLRLHSMLEESIASVKDAFSLKLSPEKIARAFEKIRILANDSEVIMRYVLFKFFQSHAFRIMHPTEEKAEFKEFSCDLDQVTQQDLYNYFNYIFTFIS
jgi:hypothetical protein